MVDTPRALQALVERSRHAPTVALDTEFVWDRTYYPKLGLVQVAVAEEECYLVDAVALPDLSPLGELLAAGDQVKILHDAPQDLTILRQVTGASPRTIFDTRCAAALAGLSSTLSLGELVAQVTGVELAKTQARTNWRQRPLTPEQLVYAVDDVRHLPAVRQALVTRIRARGRESWLGEELTVYDAPELYTEKDPLQQYRRVKGVDRVSPRDLAVLRELAAWREEEARRADRPRERILSDSVLVRLVRKKPRSPSALRSLQILTRQYETQVLERIERGLAVADDDCPRRPRGRPADEERLETQLDLALACMRDRSRQAEIDPPFVATRAEVKGLIREGPDAIPERHRLLRGWRRALVGDELLALIANGK
jgi:ribonuclease D